MTEEQKTITQKLNNWVETMNNFGSNRKNDNYQYIDIYDNEFIRFYEIAKNHNGYEPKDKLKFYPEHFDHKNIGIKSNEVIFKELNEHFDIEMISSVLNYLSDNQIKEILTEENYLLWLTDKWFYENKKKQDGKKVRAIKIHDILTKLKEINAPEDLILQIWRELFNIKSK